MSQVHKRFTPDQVQELLERYSNKEIERKYIQEILGIKKRRFFTLLKEFNDTHFAEKLVQQERIEVSRERTFLWV